jgi:hypothetical protein
MKKFAGLILFGAAIVAANSIAFGCPSYANCAGQECRIAFFWKGSCTGRIDPWTGQGECYCSKAIRADDPEEPVIED